jgi:SAM-dependent methyltransferase
LANSLDSQRRSQERVAAAYDEAMPDSPTPGKSERARSFARVATEYERGRPGYPRAAIEWLLGVEPLEVLDLGAGTGKLTAALLEAGHRVIAVEPLAEMREILTARQPRARALAGSAERLPLEDASVDAVTVGAAFHWFDQDLALAEIARVRRARPAFWGCSATASRLPPRRSRACARSSDLPRSNDRTIGPRRSVCASASPRSASTNSRTPSASTGQACAT